MTSLRVNPRGLRVTPKTGSRRLTNEAKRRQDGCVFALKADGTLSAYLGKFTTQTLNTNNQGLPA
jgi:hypothetical protein